MTASRRAAPGDVLLRIEHASLTFGGIKALVDVSFDVLEHEIRAIIGPNGAGKSSLLNLINGVYAPLAGTISYLGQARTRMHPPEAARLGIARTFQSLALFKGMSVLDNIMTGRTLRMRSGLLAQALYLGPAAREEI
jgi:branched-chain amino acid transport system ATP-binding protein